MEKYDTFNFNGFNIRYDINLVNENIENCKNKISVIKQKRNYENYNQITQFRQVFVSNGTCYQLNSNVHM